MSPQTNGICECFHKTILNEFYQVTFRKKLYGSMEELQKDLDEWIGYYNKTTEMVYKVILHLIGSHLKTEINEALVTNSKHHRSPYISTTFMRFPCMVTGYPSEIRKSLYGSGGACWKTHYRQKLTVGSRAVMAVIYYVAMISHQGLIRIFLSSSSTRRVPIKPLPPTTNTSINNLTLTLTYCKRFWTYRRVI